MCVCALILATFPGVRSLVVNLNFTYGVWYLICVKISGRQ